MIDEGDQAMTTALRLAKSGWAGGDPERILEMRCDTVIGMVEYESFLNDYEIETIALNRRPG